MATVFTPLYNSPDEENNEGKQVASELSLTSASGPAGGGPAATNANPLAARQGSGQAVNLQNYIKANVGGGDQIAQGIRSNLENQANQLNRGVDQAEGEFEGKSKPLEDELANKAKDTIQTAFKDPQALLKQQQQLQQFQRYRDMGANADIDQLRQNQQQSLSQLGNSSQFNNIRDAAQHAGKEAGQFQLLQQTFGNPQYSAGQQRLDQLLLQAQPNVTRNLQQGLGQIQQTAEQRLQGLDASGQARLSALQGLSKKNSEDIFRMLQTGDYGGQEIGAGFDDINQSVQQKIAQGAAQALDQPRLLQALKNNHDLTSGDIANLGLGDVSKIYNLDLGKYFTQQQSVAPNASDIASNDEIQRYHALQQLAGGSAPADIFGGAQENTGWKPYQFDRSAFDQDLVNAQNEYKSVSDSFGAQGDSTKALIDFYYLLNGVDKDYGDYSNAMRSRYGLTGENNLSGLEKALKDYESRVPSWVIDQYRNSTGQYGSPGYAPAEKYRQVYGAIQKYYGLNGDRYLNGAAPASLPTNADGTINWSQIQAPTGGAGKDNGPEPILAPTK